MHIQGGIAIGHSKERKTRRKKCFPDPAVLKKQEARNVVNPLFKRSPKYFSIGKTSSPNEISLLRMVQLGWSTVAKGSLGGSKYLLPLTNSLRPWINQQLPS